MVIGKVLGNSGLSVSATVKGAHQYMIIVSLKAFYIAGIYCNSVTPTERNIYYPAVSEYITRSRLEQSELSSHRLVLLSILIHLNTLFDNRLHSLDIVINLLGPNQRQISPSALKHNMRHRINSVQILLPDSHLHVR